MKSYIKIKLTHKFYSTVIYNIKIGNNLRYPSTGKWKNKLWSVQFSQLSYPTPCDPMDCSTPGFPVYYQLPESTQIHIHHVGDTIQSSHPLSSPSSPPFNLSQHQGLFQGVSSSHQVAKVFVSASASVLPMNIED